MATVVDERLVEHFGFSDSGCAEEEPVIVGTEQMIGREGECFDKHLLADGKTASEETESNEIAGEVAKDMSLDLVIGRSNGFQMGIGDNGVVCHDRITFVTKIVDNSLDLVG